MASQLKDLPEERRKAVDNFLSVFKRSKEKEIERFHKELPGGRVVVFTNSDHHCFIDKESEVVREMRDFLRN
jgi:pimeloyl-ACP methyl ester carboxylesterase